MPTKTFNTSFLKSQLTISPSELKERYFLGIPLEDNEGNPMSDRVISSFILDAQTKLENFLNLKFLPQILTESVDYRIENFRNWGFMPTSFPVVNIHKLIGIVSGVEQFSFDKDWFSIKKSADGLTYQRAAHLLPGKGSMISFSALGVSGNIDLFGFIGSRQVPNYWEITYTTGFKDGIPEDIKNVLGKIASMNVFNVLGDIVLGAGIAAQNISIDGLSEGIQTTQSAENSAYSARIRQYEKDLKVDLKLLRSKYDQPLVIDC